MVGIYFRSITVKENANTFPTLGFDGFLLNEYVDPWQFV